MGLRLFYMLLRIFIPLVCQVQLQYEFIFASSYYILLCLVMFGCYFLETYSTKIEKGSRSRGEGKWGGIWKSGGKENNDQDTLYEKRIY